DGYILMYVLDNPSPWFTLPIMILLLIFATFTVYHRTKLAIYFSFKILFALAMFYGITVNLVYFFFVVLQLYLCYNAYYLILIFATFTVYQPTKPAIYFSFKKLIALSMFTGITVNLVYFMFVVLQLDPWYNPQYFIPIGGMIIGKTMTGVSLGVNNLLTGMR